MNNKDNRNNMDRYTLVTRPEGRAFTGDKRCFAVDPASDRLGAAGIDPTCLDQAYMAPRTDGEYTMYGRSDGHDHGDKAGALADYDGHVFVPDDATAAAAMNDALEFLGLGRRYLARGGRLFLCGNAGDDQDDIAETTRAALDRDWNRTLPR